MSKHKGKVGLKRGVPWFLTVFVVMSSVGYAGGAFINWLGDVLS